MFGLEIFGVLLKGLRIFWGVDFCPHLIIPALETRSTPRPPPPLGLVSVDTKKMAWHNQQAPRQQRCYVTSSSMFCDENHRGHSLFLDMTDRCVTCFSKLNAQDAERVKIGCLVEKLATC